MGVMQVILSALLLIGVQCSSEESGGADDKDTDDKTGEH